MKKIVALLLTCVLLVSVFVVPAVAETPSVAIVVAGSLGDRSFYDSSNEGIQQLAAEFGTVTKVLECKEDGSLYESYLYDAADVCDIVCAVGWQFYDALPSVVESYSDVKFVFIDNDMDEIAPNLMPVVYAQNEGSYLVGYIAGKMTQTGKIGAVGGENSATINDFIVGYEAGAKQANPDVVVEVQYAGSFEDPATGKACAAALYSSGCDIVFQVAGKTGEGVFEAASEVGKYAIGVDGDQKYINPDVIICSMVKQVGKSIYDLVSDAENFYKGGETWHADMATGYIDVVYGEEGMTQQVSDELKAEIEQIKQQIINGELTVPTALN